MNELPDDYQDYDEYRGYTPQPLTWLGCLAWTAGGVFVALGIIIIISIG